MLNELKRWLKCFIQWLKERNTQDFDILLGVTAVSAFLFFTGIGRAICKTFAVAFVVCMLFLTVLVGLTVCRKQKPEEDIFEGEEEYTDTTDDEFIDNDDYEEPCHQEPKVEDCQPKPQESKAEEQQPEHQESKAEERQPEPQESKVEERQPEPQEPKAEERQPEPQEPKAEERQPEPQEPKAEEQQPEPQESKAEEQQPECKVTNTPKRRAVLKKQENPSEQLVVKENVYERAKRSGKPAFFFTPDAILYLADKCMEDLEKLELYENIPNRSMGLVTKVLEEHFSYTSPKALRIISHLNQTRKSRYNVKALNDFVRNYLEVLPATKRELQTASKLYKAGIQDQYEKLLSSEETYEEFLLCAKTFERKAGPICLVTNNPRLVKLANKNAIRTVSIWQGNQKAKMPADVMLLESDRVFLMDKSVAQHLAEYFERKGISYSGLLKEETISTMDPLEATLVRAFKLKRAFVPGPVAEELCYPSGSGEASCCQVRRGRSEAKAGSGMKPFGERYMFLVVHTHIQKELQNGKNPEESNPSLLEHALALKKETKLKVAVLSTQEEALDFEPTDGITKVLLSDWKEENR